MLETANISVRQFLKFGILLGVQVPFFYYILKGNVTNMQETEELFVLLFTYLCCYFLRVVDNKEINYSLIFVNP